MEIRIASQADHQGVMSLMRQLNRADPEINLEQSSAIYDTITRSRWFSLIVAEFDGRLVGTCYLNIVPNLTRESRPYALIENVVTDRDYRNRGIGRAVMRHAVALAREARCYKVMLMTGRSDDAVHAFYESCGFIAGEKFAYIQRFD